MNCARSLVTILSLTFSLWPAIATAQQDCSHPPKPSGDSWWREYATWCSECGGTFDADAVRCIRGRNWGRKTDQPLSGRTEGEEVDRRQEDRLRQEQEELQREEEERRREREEHLRAEAEATKRRTEEFDRKKESALQEMKGIGAELGLKDIGANDPAGPKDLGSPAVSELGLKEIGASSPGLEADPSAAVRQEQDEFDQMNAAWLKRQQEAIRAGVAEDARWTSEVLASIRTIRVPSPVFRPRTLEDVRPGDILLIAPDDSMTARTVVRVDPLYRAIDYFSSGSVSAPDFVDGRASHALTVVRAVGGNILFLDHTGEGSRILNRADYLRKYGQRAMYIARPQEIVAGRKLWEVAREAALQKKSDYGLFGKDVVCSERAAIAVAKAAGLPLQTERHRLGGYLGPVDITPSDFFDREHVGKYFLISVAPIVPDPKRF